MLSSDWAFMVTRDQAAGYARGREVAHQAAVHRPAALLEEGPTAWAEVAQEVARLRRTDDPFPWLDACPLVWRWVR